MTALYVPGTEETDPKKQNQSLQLIGGKTTENTTAIATNTADIATSAAAIAANTAAIAAITTPTAATKANQVAGTSNAVFVAPLHQQDHGSAAKAWGFVTVSGTAIASSTLYGCTVARTGVGLYTVTVPAFTGAFNYCCFASAYNDSDNAAIIGAQTTTTVAIQVRRVGVLFDASFSFVIFGTQ